MTDLNCIEVMACFFFSCCFQRFSRPEDKDPNQNKLLKKSNLISLSRSVPLSVHSQLKLSALIDSINL